MEYLVLVEPADGNYSAYSPDIPGCVAAGDTREETLELMRGAIDMHLRGLEEDGLPLPEPRTQACYVSVSRAG